jgi:carbon storage regulator
VTVTVLTIGHGHVRIGIEAPRSIPVHHEEIYQRIHLVASSSASNDDPGDESPDA